MDRKHLAHGLAALGLTAGVTPPAPAQQNPPQVKPAPQREVIRWPGGWMYLDAPGVIYRDSAPPPALGAAATAPARRAGSLTIVSNSGNGAGNRVGVDAGASGLTVLHNARNGFGNRVTVTPAGAVVAIPARAGARGVKPTPVVAWWEWLDDLP